MLLSSGHLVFGWIVGPTRESRLIAYPPRGCSLRVRREQPVLDRHRPVSNLRGDLWPSLQGRLTLLLVSPPVSAGGVTRRSAPGQLCGLALLTRWTCPHLDGRLLYSAVGRVSSPRRFAHASCRGKIPLEFLLLSLLMLVVVPSVRKRVSGNSVGPKKLKKARLPVHT